MPVTPDPEVVAEWRVRGRRRLFLVLPVLVFITVGSSSVLRLLAPGRDRWAVLDVGVACALGVGAALSAVVAARTRVRVLADGLQVREVRTRTYAWSQISDVRVDRWSGSRTVKLELTDGTVRTLPVPFAARGGGSELAGAVEIIGSRLTPDRGRGHREEPTALDDLLD